MLVAVVGLFWAGVSGWLGWGAGVGGLGGGLGLLGLCGVVVVGCLCLCRRRRFLKFQIDSLTCIFIGLNFP